MKFIELVSIDGTDIKRNDDNYNAELSEGTFSNRSERCSIIENTLRRWIKEEKVSVTEWRFKSPGIVLVINAEEISYMSEIMPTIDGIEISEEFWPWIPRATEIIFKDGTKKLL